MGREFWVGQCRAELALARDACSPQWRAYALNEAGRIRRVFLMGGPYEPVRPIR